MIRDSGHNALLFPSLRIEKLQLDIDTNKYDSIIFISINAVTYSMGQIKLSSSNSCNVFAVGRATADKLEECGIRVDCFPKKSASSEELLSMPMVSSMQNKKILIVRGRGGRETLKIGLSKKHNDVDYAEVYERVECELNDTHRDSLTSLLKNSDSVITITSIESLQSMLSIANKIDSDCLKNIKSLPLVVLSDRILRFAKSVGFLHLYVAPETNNKGLVAVINQLK
ncbi:MAG: uroporphyrinogen-III synthase [PS1 clade bacterium]|jgi:uroporphyrinogen-III synthase|tara:strand:+ start:507 stop:1187 length:681 start_codon:yes stop_codon:yes gene_type:complete